MPAPTLPVSSVIDVQWTLSPIAAATRNFGSLLILGDSPVISTTERIRQYADLTGVTDDFGLETPEYAAASLYFGQTPKPSVLFIGRWDSGWGGSGFVPAELRGATRSQSGDPFYGMDEAEIWFVVGGVEVHYSGFPGLSAASDVLGVAAAINATLSNTSIPLSRRLNCRWDATSAQRFVISTNNPSVTLSYATGPDAETLGAALGVTEADGGVIIAGRRLFAETLPDAVAIMIDQSTSWYGINYAYGASVTDDDLIACAALIEGQTVKRIMGVTTQDANVKSLLSTTDLAARLKALSYNRTFVQYSSSNPYAVTSAYGKAFTVNFNGSNTTITLKFKIEPGVVPENLTTTQAAALKTKRCNVYAYYNNDTAILQEGQMSGGDFFDEVHGLDWLENLMQTNYWNLLYTSGTKIPQTDGGMGMIHGVLTQALDQGVQNGLIAPGVWNADGFGGLNRGDYLTSGYYVYMPPIDEQNQSDREARKAPLAQIAVKLAGAVHSGSVIINVNR